METGNIDPQIKRVHSGYQDKEIGVKSSQLRFKASRAVMFIIPNPSWVLNFEMRIRNFNDVTSDTHMMKKKIYNVLPLKKYFRHAQACSSVSAIPIL